VGQGQFEFARPPAVETFADGAFLLSGFALADAPRLLAAIDAVVAAAPLRHVETPGGKRMSVAMSNCGERGWVSDRRGYRYEACDPTSGQPWPAMPAVLRVLAARAAAVVGWADFAPDACLVNRYAPGARMTLHQDRDEADFSWPIVSVSLGLSATFLFGGRTRSGPVQRVPLEHGDVVVFGGASRLCFHGVSPVRDGVYPAVGPARWNLTFRVTRAHRAASS
jgi:alkylated DNA repair protein (DNA oxidative demethylase)